jgi:Domain of unknown function (DUF4388)
MNIWLAVGIVVGLVLIGLVAVGVRRPRHIEDTLSPPKRRPTRTDAIGTLDQASLRDFLRSVQVERKTGSLRLTAGEQWCSLYFLFGHLFHAVSDTQTGEAALRECLGWSEVRYAFDKEAKLPTEETIERPMDDVLAG